MHTQLTAILAGDCSLLAWLPSDCQWKTHCMCTITYNRWTLCIQYNNYSCVENAVVPHTTCILTVQLCVLCCMSIHTSILLPSLYLCFCPVMSPKYSCTQERGTSFNWLGYECIRMYICTCSCMYLSTSLHTNTHWTMKLRGSMWNCVLGCVQ